MFRLTHLDSHHGRLDKHVEDEANTLQDDVPAADLCSTNVLCSLPQWGWGGSVPSSTGAGSHLSLHHSRPLGPERLDCLEKIDHSFVPHPLQHDAEGDEDSGPANAGTVDTHTRTHTLN